MKYVPLVLMLTMPVMAQQKASERPHPPEVMKFIDVKYLSGERLERVVHFVGQLYIGKARVIHDSILNVLMIQSDNPADAAKAEEMLRRFDVPTAVTRAHRQIQLTVYMLEPADEVPAAQRPPAELASAVEQLQKLLAHKQFRLVQTTFLVSREETGVSTTGTTGSTPERLALFYSAKYKSARYVESQKQFM